MAALLLQLHPDWHAVDFKRLLRSNSNTLSARMLNAAIAIAKQDGQH
jgi:hypothetical protein